MAQPRPYRAGLGLPEPIRITSSAAPPREDHEDVQEYDSDSESDPNIELRGNLEEPNKDASTPYIYQSLPKDLAWREWNINPSGHGPDRLKRPPTFVKSTIEYDELGRSVADGVGVDVDLGERDVRDGGERKKGEDVRDWYLALAARRREGEKVDGAVVPTVTPLTPPARPFIPGEIIEFLDSPSPSPPSETPRPPNPRLPTPPRQQKWNKLSSSEWFIHRALLSSQSLPLASSSSTSTSTSRQNIPLSLPISSLLTIPSPLPPRPNMPTYVLGPENRGYGLLQGLGWAGGGLGKPEGWAEGEVREDNPDRKGKRKATPEEEVQEVTADGQAVIDLTLSSGSSASGSSDEDEADTCAPGPSGPGRTAPIAIALKLDRSGLGRSRSRAKVTHTHKEILLAQKRAKYGQKKLKKGEMSEVDGKQGGMGTREKMDWKKKDRKDREERRRLLGMLNH